MKIKSELLYQLKTEIENIEKDFEELKVYSKHRFNAFIAKHIDLLAFAIAIAIEEANRIYREVEENPEEILSRKDHRNIEDAIKSLQKGRDTLDKISVFIGNQ